jgi:hypothetical protein
MKIYAPVKDFNGWRNNVRFVNGIGETDNPKAIEWFKTNGYTVEKCEKITENSLKKCDNYVIETPNDQIERVNDEIEVMGYPEQDFEEMTPNELREWAIEHGLGAKIRNTRNKEKLLEILRG